MISFISTFIQDTTVGLKIRGSVSSPQGSGGEEIACTLAGRNRQGSRNENVLCLNFYVFYISIILFAKNVPP